MVQQCYLEVLKHMWYVELVIIVTVACDALPEIILLSIFCLILNAEIEVVHSISYLLIFFN